MDKNRKNELILKILEYVENNLHKPISLDEISESTCLSKYHLHRLMKDVFGEPLISYITRIRLECALMYLKISSKTVAEIASDVGYASVNSFIKAFKKRFGVPPKTFLSNFEFKKSPIKGNLSVPKTMYINTIYAVYIPVLGKYGGENFDDAWTELIEYITENKLLNDKTRYLGIYFDDPKVTEENQCRTYVCATIDKAIKTKTAHISSLKIDAGLYSVYTFQGKYSELSTVYDCIFGGENLIVHQYKTHFEEYILCDSHEPITRIFIPIAKSAR